MQALQKAPKSGLISIGLVVKGLGQGAIRLAVPAPGETAFVPRQDLLVSHCLKQDAGLDAPLE